MIGVLLTSPGSVVAVCGNDLCETGERCKAGSSEACCIEDCPLVDIGTFELCS